MRYDDRVQCPVCKAEMGDVERPNLKYCGNACRQMAYRRRKKTAAPPPPQPKRIPKRLVLTQVQRARWSRGLPGLQIDPDLEREAEIRAHKRVLAELEQAHKKATAGRKRLLREVTLDQALKQPDPEAVYLGVGYAANAGRDVEQLVLLIGKDDRVT